MLIIGWLTLGLIGGFIAGKLVSKAGEGAVLDIALAIVGIVAIGLFLFAFVQAPVLVMAPDDDLQVDGMFVGLIAAIAALFAVSRPPAASTQIDRGSTDGSAGAMVIIADSGLAGQSSSFRSLRRDFPDVQPFASSMTSLPAAAPRDAPHP